MRRSTSPHIGTLSNSLAAGHRRRATAGFLGIVTAAALCASLLLQPTPPSARQPARIAILTIHQMIDDVVAESIERRGNEAIADGATVIVIELNTPGGLVSSSVDICKYLRRISEDQGIKTVAWVRDEAISGGTMISMACDEIIMTPYSLIGDCGVILMGPGGASTTQDPALDAKIESYVLAVFDSAATRVGYDPLLCDSFVRHEIEVWWIEHKTTAERRFVTREEKEELFGEAKEGSWASRMVDKKVEWQLVKTYIDPRDNEEKNVRQPVVPDNKLLTMDQSQAFALGFSKAIVRTEKELQERYGATGAIARFESTWSEDLVSWLTSPMVRMFLIAMVGMGTYTEMKAPGLGLPGLLAVAALVVLLGAPYVTGLANVWEILFVILGIGLLFVEVFVIPGFGVAGVTGLVFLIIGLLATFMPPEPDQPLPIYWPSLPASFDGLRTGVKVLGMSMGMTLVGMVLISRYLPYVPYFRNLIPANPNFDNTANRHGEQDIYHGVVMLGNLGVTESQLRPSGKARFGSTLVDVLTQGELVEAGCTVEVISRTGNHVIVREVQQET